MAFFQEKEMSIEISVLNNRNSTVSEEIYKLFQNSYKIEQAIIGVVDFPPLKRTVEDIQKSNSMFGGLFYEGRLVSLIEYTIDDNEIMIDSFVTSPKYFRRGFGSRLFQYFLSKHQSKKILVETALKNNPAITFYKKFRFTQEKIWATPDNIEIITLIKKN